MNAVKVVALLGCCAVFPASSVTAQDIGPLAAVVDQQLISGWQASAEGGWFVLRNDSLEGSEQTLVISAGPPPSAGRTTSVNVSLNSTRPEASIGLVVRSATANDVCLMEITAEATAILFCVIGGQRQDIASVPGAARLDGSDVIAMIEVPGSARFLLNDTVIGDVTAATALGGEVGVMAYERGTFGLADFVIADAEPIVSPTPPTGSGLPPRGGAAGSGLPPKGGAAPAAEVDPTAADPATDPNTRMAAIMGPLAESILASTDKAGWELFYEDDRLVFTNPATASSERFFTMPAGPLAAGERITTLTVGILPPEGQTAGDFANSAAGILIEGNDGVSSCIGEITGGKDGLVICFGADGKAAEIGRLPGAALGNGTDVLELIEQPGAAQFRLNGQMIASLRDSPALGGKIGVLAYERGQFYFGDFAISTASEVAAAAPTGGPESGPLPMFGNEEARLIGVYVGITNGIFMHEFGHALIGELEVPSTGPEEDAVDIFSALRVVEPTMYPSGDPAIDAIGREVAIYSALPWYYGGRIGEQSGFSTPWQDEHTGDLKRFRNAFCVIYGGNPALYSDIAQEVGLEERTLGRCEEEFTRQNRAWRTILAPHTRVGTWHPEGLLPADAPGADITVIFEPSQSRVGQFVAQTFGDGLTGFATDLAKTYALPRALTVTYRDCGELNAWYSPGEASITMCYELIEHLAVMISDIEMGTEGGMDTGAVPSAGEAPQTSTAPATTQPGVDLASLDPAAGIDETVEFSVPSTTVLFPSPYRGPTPVGNPKASTLNTGALVQLLGDGTAMLLIDTSGRPETIDGAMSVTDAGKDGSLTDSFQSVVENFLQQNASDKTLPIIFFGAGLQDRSAYNAALRAGNLGWNAFWYRGGVEAWQSNGLPLVPLQ